MKIFRSESKVDYDTYTFNYAVYCLQEKASEIESIYDNGFLPYSNSTDIKENIYYLARSLRVNLDQFQPTSENRRITRKMAEISPDFRVIEKNNFIKNEDFNRFCLDYASIRFDGKMLRERFDYIYAWTAFNYIFQFEANGKILGYVFAVISEKTLHYWFSFYDLNYSRQGLGKWMMFSVIQWAQENSFEKVYLGTCYGEKAMYKMRDFKGLAFYDGNAWNPDMKLLKSKCKSDAEFMADDFKINSKNFLNNIK